MIREAQLFNWGGVGWALVGLVPHLSEPLKGELLRQSLEAVYHFEKNFSAENLRGLPLYLPEPFKGEMLRAALAAARELPDKNGPDEHYRGSRAEALAGLISYLPFPLNEEVAIEALNIIITKKIRRKEGFFGRTWVITQIAPHLPGPLLKKALTTTWIIDDEWWRGVALAKLAPYLPQSLNAEILRGLLDTVSLETEQDNYRTEVFVELVPYLTRTSLKQMLGLVQKTGWSSGQADILIGLAPRLSEPLLQEALIMARGIDREQERARALFGLIPYLPEDLAEKILLEVREAVASLFRFRFSLGLGKKEFLAILAQLTEPLLYKWLTLAVCRREHFVPKIIRQTAIFTA